jgi:AbrB family looped-hinge helix DNA binding protein
MLAMSELSVTVSSKGQVAIPKAVRDQLGLREGTKLQLRVEGRDLILRKPSTGLWRTWAGKFAGIDLTEQRRQDRLRELELDDRTRVHETNP